jgi:uncharacterized repeat protein (TIGR03847 family)
MSRVVYIHDSITRCVVGTVGVPGERLFFLQVSSATGTNCVSLEKTQVIALSERLRMMIKELRRNQLASHDELDLGSVRDDAPLDYPITEDFRVGVIGISWDQSTQRITIEAQSIGDETVTELLAEDEAELLEDAPDLLSLNLRINQARAFCDRSDSVVAAGRQPCPFCGLPIDPEGHLCPRANGYRR